MRTRRSRWITWAVAISATGGLLVIAWVIAAHVHREPPHRAVFDAERDLPPLPAQSDNGWTLVAEHERSVFEPEPPGTLLLSVDQGPPHLAEWEELQGELERWEPSPGARAILEDALSRPRFVPVCEALRPCPAITWLEAHRVATGLALREAALGWDAEALARAERILRADRDALLNARLLITVVVAEAMTLEAIELASLIGAIIGARDEVALDGGLRERIDAVERAVEALEPETWTMERALIGEAIWVRRSLDELPAPTSWRGWVGAYDFARTTRVLDEYFEAAIRYARDPAGVAPPEPPRAGQLWRALDPVGSQVLETMRSNAVPMIDRFERDAARAEERVAAARVALAAARARVEHALANRP